MSKILEKIVSKQINYFLKENKIISDAQSDFRKGHSTTSLRLDLTDEAIRAVDAGKAMAMVMLDCSKAFDTIDHKLLCAKLKYIGLDDISTEFFASYLSNRRQGVVIDHNFRSHFQRITSGVPQGSVLGPLLFTIYTFDIELCHNFLKIRAFAVDHQLCIWTT